MVDFVQKQVLDPASFSNANTNAIDAVKVRVDSGSVVGDAIAAAIASGTVPAATDTVQGKVALNLGTAAGDATNSTDALTATGLAAILNGTSPNTTPNALQAAVASIGAITGTYAANPAAPDGAEMYDPALGTFYKRVAGVWIRTSIFAGARVFAGFATPPVGWATITPAAVYSYAAFPELCAAHGIAAGGSFSFEDTRGEFIRVFDDGRGVDAGRVIGSFQGDAIRNITGIVGNLTANANFATGLGALSWAGNNGTFSSINGGGSASFDINIDASRVVPTANENRPRNIANAFFVKL